MITSLIVAAIVVGVDQLTKFLIYGTPAGSVVGNLLWFESTLNTGVAFSMFEGMQWLFIVIASVASILFIYLIVLGLNFFISSGSAKAFLLMPLIVPLAQIFDISSQLSVMAFAFGDGFSNVLYPTNPVLLISLGMVGISYVKWLKFSLKIQVAILAATSALLLFGLAIGY